MKTQQTKGLAGVLRPAIRAAVRNAVRPGPARGLIAFLLLLVWLLAAAPPLAAGRDGSAGLLVDIRIDGAPEVERGQIIAELRSRVGEEPDSQKISKDIKSIFALGFFDDVKAEIEELPGRELVLIITVVEKARIASVTYMGNNLISNTKIEEALTLKTGLVYSAREVKENLDKVRQVYRDKGYFKVNISSRVEKISKERYGLTIIIEETPRVYITEISTRKNKVITELEIQRMIKSAEIDCFSWVNESGVFDEMRINQDLQIVSAAYLTQGYIRLRIEKPAIRMVHNREFSKVSVQLTLHEGAQYFAGEIDITGDFLGEKDDLMDALELKSGNIYNPFIQNQDRFRLSEIHQEQGYAFVRVIPDIKIHDSTRKVDVTYRIVRGDKAYIGRIEFQGNRETRDYVMRREFEVRENELFNGRNLRLSHENLTRLGYFSPGLSLDRRETDVDNILDIVTRLEETQTGTLQAAIGYSSHSGLTGTISLSKGNLLGRGQTIRVTAKTGQRNVTREFTFDFIDPHAFDSEFSSDSSLSLTTFDDISELNRGSINQTRVSQGVGYPLIPFLRVNFSLALTKRSFEHAVSEPNDLRSFTPSLIYNTVNHPIFPSSGFNAAYSLSQIGGKLLGGDTEYRRHRIRYRKFVSLNKRSTLIAMARLRLGWLEQVGDHVIPLEDRFRLGGISTIRGYGYAEIGGPYGNLERRINAESMQAYDLSGEPVVDSNGNPVVTRVDKRTVGLNDDTLSDLRSGGIQERIFNLELVFPLAGDNIRGAIFYDAGNVNAESRQYEILGEDEPGFITLKHSVGFGIRMITPVGVLRFEYGRKLRPRRQESNDRFDFTISSLF